MAPDTDTQLRGHFTCEPLSPRAARTRWGGWARATFLLVRAYFTDQGTEAPAKGRLQGQRAQWQCWGAGLLKPKLPSPVRYRPPPHTASLSKALTHRGRHSGVVEASGEVAGSSPQGPWVPLTSGPERPRHRNPRPPSPPATHTWPTFAGDNRDSHPNWWKQARKAGSGPPGPGSHIGRQRDRGPRRCRAARAAPGTGPAARSHGTVRSSRSHLRPKPGGSRRRFPCDRARKRARPPWQR